jgi:hypothetical protein
VVRKGVVESPFAYQILHLEVPSVELADGEPSVIFEEFVDRLLESYLPSHDPWCLLNDRHSVPPLLMRIFSELPVTVEKQSARFTVPEGGSDPTNFLGG